MAANEPDRPRASERLEGDERLIEFDAVAATLQAEGQAARNGHRQITVVHEHGLSVLLFEFDAGGRLADHAADGQVLIQALAGALEVQTASTTHELRAGSMLVLAPGTVHDVTARVPSRMLLTVHLDQS